MNKYFLTTALTVASASAFAQGYGYDYNNYNYNYNYNYENQGVTSQPEYIENQPTYQQQAYTAEPQQQALAAKPMAHNSQAGTAERNWDLSVTVGAAYGAEYKGAKDSETTALIAPKGEYRLDPWQKLFISLDKGVGYSYALTNNLEIGAGFGYRKGRDTKDARILTGLADVDATATYMAFATYNIDAYNLGVKIEKGLDSSNDGMTTELSAGYKTKLSPKLVVGTKLATVYGDDTYMEQNYGVYSANAGVGRGLFDAEGGFSEASLSVFGNYHIKGPHSVMGSVKYTKLLGDAKDSTITEDDTDVSAIVGYTYKF